VSDGIVLRSLWIATALLGVGLVACSLVLPWVWVSLPSRELVSVSGLAVVRGGLDDPWWFLGLAPLVTAVTVCAAWLRSRVVEWIAIASLIAIVAALLLGVAWNHAAVPGAIVQRLGPGGTWWLSVGPLLWTAGQTTCVLAIVQRRVAAEELDQRRRWWARPGASGVGRPLPHAALELLPTEVRELAVDAHRLRADLDAPPVSALTHGQVQLLLDLIARLDDEAWIHELTPRTRLGVDEVFRLDGVLHRFVRATLAPQQRAYR
jgi:hypothetical protein